MNNNFEYDYKIITIDSDCAFFLTSNICDFYINLDEPLRNVIKLNVITLLINIPNSSVLKVPLNSIYINLNNYNRLIGKNNTLNDGKRSDINVFDSIIIENVPTETIGNTTIRSDFVHSDSVYSLNPIEPQLLRFNIKLFNKDNILINKSDINRFVMKLGVYYNNKKTTRI